MAGRIAAKSGFDDVGYLDIMGQSVTVLQPARV
jgi:hypothetical protein